METAQPAGRAIARLLFDPRGRVARTSFAFAAAALGALKIGVDFIVAEHVLGSDWSWRNYLFSTLERPMNGGVLPTAAELTGMLSIAAPFAWIGVALMAKRLRSAGCPVWLVIFFFVPFAKYFLFAILCTLPAAPAEAQDEPSRATRGRNWIPVNPFASAAIAVVVTSGVGVLLIALSVKLQFAATYGGWLFLGLPFVMGFIAAYILGVGGPRRLRESIGAALMTLLICGVVLLAIAIEGIICLVMAAPIAICEATAGAWIAHILHESVWRRRGRGSSIAAAIATLPLLMLAEHHGEAPARVFSVTSEVAIDAPRSLVWQHVIAFGELPPPQELIFRAGVAYPKHATIDGSGVGAVRHCVFSTGAFVEPITVWDEPARLAFDVREQPDPLRELSPYRDLQTPHLEDYFKSVRGEFRLVEAGPDRTVLLGTTWYQNKIEPQFYWRYWSDLLIHRIHMRVLEHIKREAEDAVQPPALTHAERRSIVSNRTAP